MNGLGDFSPYGLAASTCEALKAEGWIFQPGLEQKLRSAIRENNFREIPYRAVQRLKLVCVVLRTYSDAVVDAGEI